MTLTEMISSPANIRAGEVYAKVRAGDTLDGVDLAGLPGEFLVRDGNSRTKGLSYALLGTCVVAKNLHAFVALTDAGMPPMRGELTDILQKVFAPYENWVVGPTFVMGGIEDDPNRHLKTRDRLPIEWAAAVEKVSPGRLQSWSERAWNWHSEGVEGLEKMERCGVKLTPRLANNVLHYAISCSHARGEIAANHGPIVRYYFAQGGQPITPENIGNGRHWLVDVLACPLRIPDAVESLRQMGLSDLPELTVLKSQGTKQSGMPTPVAAPEIQPERGGRQL